uniref:SHSP domain-containing protein n=1 Tax=Pseudictyota dubia TaxID=2749911 RepID=A0A7R9Z495_9STRA|mmetsp:Transcript_22353/g.41667  ORF Transcript_22353/g.41667 Transcript_22353/m.41667 type:complete len:262 (+) Transcript_22353:44-829(+)
MKIVQPLAVALVAAPASLVAEGYYVGGFRRPYRAAARFSSPKERAEYFRKRQERMNREFEKLQEELQRQQQNDKSDEFGSNVGNPYEPFRMDEETLRKQREWVSRAFDIASDFNSDFAPTQKEAEQNDELIRKSKEWIERMYGIEDAPKKKDVSGFKPRYEIRTTDEKFEVALDVPGVAREDIEITLEEDGKVLMIQGERELLGVTEEGELEKVKFSEKFDFDENANSDKISARLEKGVLVVAAPKKIPDEGTNRKSIPVM